MPKASPEYIYIYLLVKFLFCLFFCFFFHVYLLPVMVNKDVQYSIWRFCVKWNVKILSTCANCNSVNISGHVHSTLAASADRLAASSVHR